MHFQQPDRSAAATTRVQILELSSAAN